MSLSISQKKLSRCIVQAKSAQIKRFFQSSRIVLKSRSSNTIPSFATADPWNGMNDSKPHVVHNLLNGQWISSKNLTNFPDPLHGGVMLQVSEINATETTHSSFKAVSPSSSSLPSSKKSEFYLFSSFISSLNSCPKSGLHNPLKNPQRYLDYGSISALTASKMKDPLIVNYFVNLIQRVAPKSVQQARGEFNVTQKFMENFSGDQVRFLARGFSVPGDHTGQQSNGYRWPYGPVVIIAPFNFPIEIPMLQLMGALYMGNKVLLKVDSRVSVVMEQALRLLHSCGLPLTDVDFINCDGTVMHQLLLAAQPRMTQFTGSSKIAELLAQTLHGRIKLEDAGWDWKVLGPDVPLLSKSVTTNTTASIINQNNYIDYVAHVCDQDAYAYSGQKCSAQSALFIHENWMKINFLDKLKTLAARRSLSDLTLGPVLTVNNTTFLNHVEKLLTQIPGSQLLFGGKVLPPNSHNIPSCYGSFEPTAIQIPLKEFLKVEHYDLCTTEIFGPFQVVISYKDEEIDLVLEALERTHAHLTAAIVSNDILFQNKMLAATINGTTYCGIRARTTGAPQNHWFGPAGDPRGAGIGTSEAIKHVWSCHREIIMDVGPVVDDFVIPARPT